MSTTLTGVSVFQVSCQLHHQFGRSNSTIWIILSHTVQVTYSETQMEYARHRPVFAKPSAPTTTNVSNVQVISTCTMGDV